MSIRLDFSPTGHDDVGRPLGYAVARCTDCSYWQSMASIGTKHDTVAEALERAATHERIAHPNRDDAARRLRRHRAERLGSS